MTRVVLGIGATKAGTSWLYESLAAHPEVHLRSIKELHWFDALAAGRARDEIARLEREVSRMALRLEAAPEPRAAQIAARMRDRVDYMAALATGRIGDYLDYLGEGAAGRMVGDVTPAYALLPAETLRAMCAMAADVRMVYLLRDPVERLWSHVRMIARRRGGTETVDPDRARAILSRVLRGEEREIAVRGDYAGALSRLRASGARVHVDVFEEVVAGPGWERICESLGLSPHTPAAGPVHRGADATLEAPLRARAAEWLAPQYEAVAALRALPAAWHDHARLAGAHMNA